MEADELGTFDLDGGVTGVSHSDLLDDALTLLGGQPICIAVVTFVNRHASAVQLSGWTLSVLS
jgi:hypothetical protein